MCVEVKEESESEKKNLQGPFEVRIENSERESMKLRYLECKKWSWDYDSSERDFSLGELTAVGVAETEDDTDMVLVKGIIISSFPNFTRT